MDPEAAWRPCEFQLASWALEEPAAAEVWAPASLPVEYAALDIFGGTCSSLPWPYAPESSGGGQQQLVEHYYYYSMASPRTPSGGNVIVSVPGKHAGDQPGNNEEKSPQGGSSGEEEGDIEKEDDDEDQVDFEEGWGWGWGWGEKVKDAFIVDVHQMMEKKMHRYPASLQALDKTYTMPRIVAIGPYHHNLDHLKPMEKVKQVAAIHCAKQSRHSSVKGLYYAVDPALDRPRRLCLYDNDVFKDLSDKAFRKMMFRDACFLVQYILMASSDTRKIDEGLHRMLSPNRIDIHHDIMLLENQLPWDVVQAIMTRMRGVVYDELMKDYIYTLRNYVQDKDPGKTAKTTHWRRVEDWESSYKPPHLLGLVRYYTVARRGGGKVVSPPAQDPPNKQHSADQQGSSSSKQKKNKTPKKISYSVSAIELAEIGIKLTPNDTTTHPELIDMRLDDSSDAGTFTAKLYLPPLSLSIDRASYLVNMAALEQCTVESFSRAPPEDSAVCSFLRLLAIMVSRVEDVHELRERGVLHGGGGLTNKDALKFFTSLQSLRLGRRYGSIMNAIENYKQDRHRRTKFHSFCYNHKKAIGLAVSGIATFATVIGTLASIKQAT